MVVLGRYSWFCQVVSSISILFVNITQCHLAFFPPTFGHPAARGVSRPQATAATYAVAVAMLTLLTHVVQGLKLCPGLVEMPLILLCYSRNSPVGIYQDDYFVFHCSIIYIYIYIYKFYICFVLYILYSWRKSRLVHWSWYYSLLQLKSSYAINPDR